MAYVPVPKDLNAVKTKVLFNLTKRQLICFGAGAAVALPLFFLCKSCMNTSVASLIMIIVLLPFMLLVSWATHVIQWPSTKGSDTARWSKPPKTVSVRIAGCNSPACLAAA